MGGFVEGADRHQASFLPACLEDYVASGNPVRVIDALVDELDLADLGFARVQPAVTGRTRICAEHHAETLRLRLSASTDLEPEA